MTDNCLFSNFISNSRCVTMLSDKSSGIGIKKSEGNHPLTKSQTKIRATALHYGIANIRIIFYEQKNPRIGLVRGHVKQSHLIKFKRSRSIFYCIAYVFQCIQECLKFILCELCRLSIYSISIYSLVQPVPAFSKVFLCYVAE